MHDDRVSMPHRGVEAAHGRRDEAAMAAGETRVAPVELHDAERAWRQGRAAAFVTMGALPILLVAAWLGVGAWTLLVTLPAGPWLVLGVMWSVEKVAAVRLARAATGTPPVAIEVAAPAVAA